MGNIRLGFYDHNRVLIPRNQRALTLLRLLLECSLILFTLGQNPNLCYIGMMEKKMETTGIIGLYRGCRVVGL